MNKLATHLIKQLFLHIALLLAISTPALATTILPVSLEQLSTKASLIFHAEVKGTETRLDNESGQIATFTEFEIIEPIKGITGTTHTIKQIGGYDASANIRLRIHGVPVFESGKQYVVFLPEKSSLGFSSPIGLHQGSFSVFTENGEKIVTNGLNQTSEKTSLQTIKELNHIGEAHSNSSNNNSIQVPLAVNEEKPTHSRLSDFINTVRSYNTP